jgi:hypothetical protein
MLLENGCILQTEQCNFIWKVSFLSLFSAIYAGYKGHYDLILSPGGVFLTSILYWIKPDYSWRRTLDISYVKLAVTYQIIRAYRAEKAYLYYATLSSSIFFYNLGVYYYKKKQFWRSTYCHSILHFLANISNIILYSGYVPPLSRA